MTSATKLKGWRRTDAEAVDNSRRPLTAGRPASHRWSMAPTLYRFEQETLDRNGVRQNSRNDDFESYAAALSIVHQVLASRTASKFTYDAATVTWEIVDPQGEKDRLRIVRGW